MIRALILIAAMLMLFAVSMTLIFRGEVSSGVALTGTIGLVAERLAQTGVAENFINGGK